jgi:hypothetical protein
MLIENVGSLEKVPFYKSVVTLKALGVKTGGPFFTT